MTVKDYERCAQTLIECVQDERRLIWLNTEGIEQAIKKEERETLAGYLRERDTLIAELSKRQAYLMKEHQFTSHTFVSAEGNKVPRGPAPIIGTAHRPRPEPTSTPSDGERVTRP